MRTIIASVAVMVASVANGQLPDPSLLPNPQGDALVARGSMMAPKKLAGISKYCSEQRALRVPGFRTEAVAQGGLATLIVGGDAAFNSATTGEPAAALLLSQAQAIEGQADAAYAAVNYRQAFLLYSQAHAAYEKTKGAYDKVDGDYVAAGNLWRDSLRY